MPASDEIMLVDGSLSFSDGVDSLKATTVATPQNPNGLKRSELAWLVNATVRDGGITQRTGWKLVGTIHAGDKLYQGAYMYQPDGGFPYIIASIGGEILKVQPDVSPFPVAVNLSAAFPGTLNPATPEQAYFVQGENYLVIQAGDYGDNAGVIVPGTTDNQGNTLPLFWDGSTLRRSKGITNPGVAPGTPNTNEIPAATAMAYYMNRLWYVNFRQTSAGDIVGGQSGHVAVKFRDAILNVTENPLVLGGDGFSTPTFSGNIRALAYAAQLDTTLGQSNLFIFTPKQIYALNVPVTRANWIAANSTNQPQISVVQIGNGAVGQRSIVDSNGDLFFQSLEPGVRSLMSTLRYVGQWNNPPLSSNEQRLLDFNDRSLMHLSSGILFDNRMLQCALPFQTPQGVAHKAVMPLDFTPLSTLGSAQPPVWEGHYEGLNILQLLVGDFGGLERAFAIVVSQTGTIDLWELTDANRFDADTQDEEKRVTWKIEFPAYNGGLEFDLKRLHSAELWVDKLFGMVEFTMEYRVDGDPCPKLWHKWNACSATNSCEDVNNPVCYPIEPRRESYRATMTLPRPPQKCETVTNRPADTGYQFQPILTIKGWCRVRGLLLHMEKLQRQLYAGKVC